MTLRRLLPPKNDLIPFALSLIPFAYLLALLVKYSVDVPFWDQWRDFVPLLEKSYQGDLSLQDLWVQHNEHRLLFPRMIMLLLARISGWNILYEIAVNVILAVGIFAVLSYQIRKTDELLGIHGAGWFLPMVSLIVFSTSQWRNWTWGWQIQIFLNVLAFVISIILLSHPELTWWRFSTAMFLGIVASYSFANGLLFWAIALVILCVVSDERRRKYAVMLLFVGATTLATYLYDYHRPAHHPSMWHVLIDPVSYIIYVLAYLGAPIASFNAQLAILIGFFGLCIFVLTCAFCFRNRHVTIHGAIPWVSLGLYSILSAVLIGIGRAGFGWGQAMSSRYVTISSLLWIANFMLLHVFVRCAPMSKVGSQSKNGMPMKFWMRFLLIIVVVGFLPMLLRSSLDGTHRLREHHDYLLPARAELFSGQDDEMLQRLFPSADLVREGIAVLRMYELSVFRKR